MGTLKQFILAFLLGVSLCALAREPQVSPEQMPWMGMVTGKYAHLRSLPTVVQSPIIRKVYRGTTVKILDKTPQKIHVGEISGYWYKVELIEEGQTGWMFDHYIVWEGHPQTHAYIQWVLSSLYYYRSDLDEELKKIKKTVSKPAALQQLTRYNARFLNYLGYHLLAERNPLAIPLFIAFMDPAHRETNRRDANYAFTWEIMERITPHIFIPNNYQRFRSWWQNHWGTIKITIPNHQLVAIFKKIVDNENREYRNLTKPPETPEP